GGVGRRARLQTHEDDVAIGERRVVGLVADAFDPRLLAVDVDERERLASPRFASDEHDVLAGGNETTADPAADRACPEDAYLHLRRFAAAFFFAVFFLPSGDA